jgi:hypothetical protein
MPAAEYRVHLAELLVANNDFSADFRRIVDESKSPSCLPDADAKAEWKRRPAAE